MATETSCQVLIIGAGISGISAAQKLQENDISDYLILEATDRVGGRIKTLAKTEDGYDYVLELGAGWIHGVNGNPVFQIAKQNKLLSQKGLKVKSDPRLVNCERQYRTPDGENVSPAIYEPVNRAYAKKFGEGETYYENVAKLFKKNGLPKGIEKDMGFGDYLYETVMSQMTEKDAKKRKLMSDVLRSRLMYETTLSGCDDMNEVSLKYIGSYTELSGGHVVLPKGYETVIDTLRTNIKKSNIILNCPVKNIKYDINGDGKCEVISSNDRTFFADYVIVTTSVGFLKENAADLFTPSLSIEKLKAIENIGFGTVDRIYSEFENLDFIPEPEVGELYLTKPEKNSTEGTGWEEKLFTFYIQNTPRANVLTAWISGHQAEAMEKSSDEEIKRKVRDVLQKHLGVEVPLPKNIIKSDWHSNPYFRGSYSFVKLGASVRDIQLLAEPVVNKSSQKPVILFAGEATSENFYSTTHGALLSGQREAQRILKFIQL